eukprot:1156126-Pelagomonas_calceolata.AAC.3
MSVNQRRVHLIEAEYCEDSRPGQQVETAQRQHADLCNDISGQAVTSHTIFLGVGGTSYTEHTLEQFKLLGLDHLRAIEHAHKHHAHSPGSGAGCSQLPSRSPLALSVFSYVVEGTHGCSEPMRDPFFVGPMLNPSTGRPLNEGNPCSAHAPSEEDASMRPAAALPSQGARMTAIVGSGFDAAGMGGTALVYESSDPAHGVCAWHAIHRGQRFLRGLDVHALDCPFLLHLPDLPEGVHCLVCLSDPRSLVPKTKSKPVPVDRAAKVIDEATRCAYNIGAFATEYVLRPPAWRGKFNQLHSLLKYQATHRDTGSLKKHHKLPSHACKSGLQKDITCGLKSAAVQDLAREAERAATEQGRDVEAVVAAAIAPLLAVGA